jgi:hypothetical protein
MFPFRGLDLNSDQGWLLREAGKVNGCFIIDMSFAFPTGSIAFDSGRVAMKGLYDPQSNLCRGQSSRWHFFEQ